MAVMIDYGSSVPQPTSVDAVTEGVLAVWVERYRQHTTDANLREFTFAGRVFLLDEAPQEASRPVHTLGAISWVVTPVDRRDTS